MKGEKYWENADMGGFRVYETYRHTGCSTETLYLLIKSPYMLNGVPPVIDLIERRIQEQKWVSFKRKRDFEYPEE